LRLIKRNAGQDRWRAAAIERVAIVEAVNALQSRTGQDACEDRAQPRIAANNARSAAGGLEMPVDPKLEFDLLKDHFENHGKSANYLLAAHGAGLIACLTGWKDYAHTPQLKGIGVLIAIFSIGLFGSS
jgi:hypothetical protein